MVAPEQEIIKRVEQELYSFIYGIRAKGSPDPFYVGSTRQSLKTRLSGHLGEIRKNKHRNPHLANKAKKLGLDNLEIYEVERVSRDQQFIREHDSLPVDYCDPQRIAYTIFATLLAPEKCEVEQNQALYSKLRKVARQAVNELLFTHRAELLTLLSSQGVSA